MIGQTIDNRYQVEDLLGKGGMGAVYRAIDLIEKRPVAVKLLHFYIDGETDMALTRFYREFRVLARLDHPNIVHAYAYGNYNEVPYLVLEFLEGRTLSEEIADGPMPRSRLLDIARQICEALIHLHTQSIVHRDLKPSNLMLIPHNGTPMVKLMDFGLIRQADVSMQLTQEGVALGTVAYMAPEQAQGIPVDFRADLYALGTVLYEMATGRPPFVHENPAMILMQQLTTSPPTPRELNPDLDEPLEQLILDLLVKEPSQRPASTERVASRLAQLADEKRSVISVPSKRVDMIPQVPLIGRGGALDELTQLWTKAKTDQGQIALVSGVAGAGKTRLLTELGLQAQIGEGRFMRGYCREHGSLPYEPMPEIFSQLLKDLPASVHESLPTELTRLLSSDIGGMSTGEPTDQQFNTGDQAEARLRLFAGCWEVMQQAAQRQPLIIAVEDIQWVDPATLDLRIYLGERIHQAPILLIVTFRPEEVNPQSSLGTGLTSLPHKRTAHRIELELLSQDQVANYLRVALQQEHVPDWLVESFYQATEGNPLFIEETLKALAAEGQVTEWIQQTTSQSINVTSTILQLPQNVLALAERRLQLLSDEDRPILTAAAVIGPEFPFALLEGVTKLDEDSLLDAIDRLLAARLIQELPLQAGEDRYRFTQEALRQALLNTVSHRRRRSLHRRTGETMMALYDTGKPRYWPFLAHHFAEAGNAARAFKYFALAGDAAAQVYANLEAVAHYTRALEAAKLMEKNQDEVPDSEQLRNIFSKRGRSLELNSLYEEALENYKDMAVLAQEHDDRELELAALLAQGTILSTPNPVQDIDQAKSLSHQAVNLSRELGDRQAEAKALWNLLLAYRYLDQPTDAIVYGEQSLAIARELNLREQMAYTLNDIAWSYLGAGQPAKTLPMLDEARELWRELGNTPMLADNLNSSAGQHALRGDTQKALGMLEEAIALSQPINNLWSLAHCWSLKGYIYLEYGELTNAIEAIEETIRLSEQGNLTHLQVSSQTDLGWAYGMMGAFDHGMRLVQEVQTKVTEVFQMWQDYPTAILAQLQLLKGDVTAAATTIEKIKATDFSNEAPAFALVWSALIRSELALINKDYPQAIATAEQLITQLHQLGVRVHVPDALYAKGRVLLAQDRIDEALGVLAEARTEAEAIGSRRSLWPILSTLSQMEARRGNTSGAENLHLQAREIINYIAIHAPPDLRSSFLALPNVRAVTENT